MSAPVVEFVCWRKGTADDQGEKPSICRRTTLVFLGVVTCGFSFNSPNCVVTSHVRIIHYWVQYNTTRYNTSFVTFLNGVTTGVMVDKTANGKVMPDFASLEKKPRKGAQKAGDLPQWAALQQKVFTNWINNKVGGLFSQAVLLFDIHLGCNKHHRWC